MDATRITENSMLVKELIEPGFVSVSPTDTLGQAWKIMQDSKLTGACVVTEEGQLVGFITDGDFIRACMPSEADIAIYDEIMEKMELPNGFLATIRSMRIEDIMQGAHQVITINLNEPLLKALALMFQHHLRRIPVLDGNQIIGTISRGMVLYELLVERNISE
jgi:CBS domain-containing protein